MEDGQSKFDSALSWVQMFSCLATFLGFLTCVNSCLSRKKKVKGSPRLVLATTESPLSESPESFNASVPGLGDCGSVCNESFSVPLAGSQIMTLRLLINCESLAYSLDLFLTSSYNLNQPIYTNLCSITWHYLSSILHLGFSLCVSWRLLCA